MSLSLSLTISLTLSIICHAQDFCNLPGAPCAVPGTGPDRISIPLPSITKTPAQSSAASVARAQAQALSSAVSYGNSVGIASGTPNATLPDPCGPPLQPPGAAQSLSTCTQNVSVADLGSHSYYGLNCWNDTTKPALDLGSCSDAIYVICDDISTGGELYTKTNKWIWSTVGGNCTFGYWLPAGGAPAPSFDRCLRQIYGPMREKCRGPRFNVGSVNIASDGLPDGLVSGTVGTGVAVRGDYPSYVMFPLKSFYGVNGEGVS